MTNLSEQFRNECNLNILKQGNDDNLKKITREWLDCANKLKYSYNFLWLSRPIIQYPQDIVQVQELIWETKPDLIIETGIAHGGSLILSASILALLDYCDAVNGDKSINPKETKRHVIGLDIDIREHNKKEIQNHPLSHHIKMFEGSSTDKEVIKKVKEIAKSYKKIMVFLDSNHTHEHVLEELRAYASLVSVGCYCVVFDTIIEDLNGATFPGRDWSKGNNPKTAVWEFLNENKNFEIDRSIDSKLMISVAPDGYLKRVK